MIVIVIEDLRFVGQVEYVCTGNLFLLNRGTNSSYIGNLEY